MRVLITGHSGFVGRNLWEYLSEHVSPKHTLVAATLSGEPNDERLDLCDDDNVHSIFNRNAIDAVVHLAAKVGGIGANMDAPADFFADNMKMGMNVLRACAHRQKYCILVGTVCSYPRDCPIPFKEDDLWNGEPEPTNGAYAEAKRGLYKYLNALYFQHGLHGTILLPTNMYGRYDNFDLRTSHVIPAIMRKMHESKHRVDLWGHGTATREFLHVEDFCRAIALTLQSCPNYPYPINIPGGTEITIEGLANTLREVTNYQGAIEFDQAGPDGQPRRKLDGTRAERLIRYQPSGRDFFWSLKAVYNWYTEQA